MTQWFDSTKGCSDMSSGYTSPMPYTNTNTGSHMPNYSPVERNIINKLKEDNSKLLANVRTLEEENKKLKAEGVSLLEIFGTLTTQLRRLSNGNNGNPF